jgi:hypothetical protein
MKRSFALALAWRAAPATALAGASFASCFVVRAEAVELWTNP